MIVDANAPYELRPKNSLGIIQCGALLIHGLYDCPFSLRDIGTRLQSAGVLCRSILLPGHGTRPDDLISISYHDWIQALRYGVESMKREVDYLFLVGYSTGAALSIYQALIDHQITGVVLIAPAIGLHRSAKLAVTWHDIKKNLGFNDNPWLFKTQELDYVKYHSMTFNSVTQVSLLTKLIREICHTRTLNCSVFLAVSDHDETISSREALKFFSVYGHNLSQLLFYGDHTAKLKDTRIILRDSHRPELKIKNFSHISLPFSSENPHYGQQGDYVFASRIAQNEPYEYGAYNRIETMVYQTLFRLNLTKVRRQTLTYNPDFDFMVNSIQKFIMRNSR
jgi:esterase/lipase